MDTEEFSASAILKNVRTRSIGRDILFYDECTSTQDMVREALQKGAAHGITAVTDLQTKGKGRRGRRWETLKGTTIAMSIGLIKGTGIDIPDASLPAVALVSAMAVAKAIEALTFTKPYIKWPNDIVINKKKISGILLENFIEPDGRQFVIIGIGINTSESHFPDEIKDTASSILSETGLRVDRSMLVAEVLLGLDKYLSIYEKTADMSELVSEYDSYLINKETEVRVLDPVKEYTGIALGIDKKGALLVESEGEIKEVDSGEVSVRGVYGYV